MIQIELQIATAHQSLPTSNQFRLWVRTALSKHIKSGVICLRIVNKKESQTLNNRYRHKNRPTNVLSFYYDEKPNTLERSPLIGDLVLCAPLIHQEAKKSGIPSLAHWAHIVVHGCLHLAGFTHDHNSDAIKMEREECRLLKKLGFPNPYQTDQRGS